MWSRAEKASIVLSGGDIYTMDKANPRATHLAMAGNRIIAVGDATAVEALIGPDTRVIDLHGHSVTPGLVDAHAHLYGLGSALESVQLRGVKSEREAAAMVFESSKSRPVGEWITGRGWDQNLWSPQKFPTAATLDELITEHPVAVRRIDGHALWANSLAIKLAGVTAKTKDPAGGRIFRNKKGVPTGVFVDSAMSLIQAKIPSAPAEVRKRRIERAAREAAKNGITSVHEMGIDDDTIAVYREFARHRTLPVRVYAFLSGDKKVAETLTTRRPDGADASARFTVRAVKFFADGALGSRGAALLEPYSDDKDNKGLWVMKPDEILKAVELAVEGGWQVGIHAIGDAANRAVLDAYEKVLAQNKGLDLRLRIEHAQVIAPADIPRFAALGVIASMQPTHCTSDMPWAEARLGKERVKGAYAWRALLDSGAVIASGSDFPVEEVPVLHGIYSAVTRQDPRGQPTSGWYPDQRMTLDEAVQSFTSAAAYAGFAEQSLGKLQKGYLADITVYDRKLEADLSLHRTRVDMTIVGGQVVFERK